MVLAEKWWEGGLGKMRKKAESGNECKTNDRTSAEYEGNSK